MQTKAKNFSPVKAFYFISFLFITVQLLIAGINFGNYPPKIPLFLSLPWGNEQLANFVYIFILPAISLFFFLSAVILNTAFTKRKEILFSFLSLIFSLICSFLCLISVIKITYLIT